MSGKLKNKLSSTRQNDARAPINQPEPPLQSADEASCCELCRQPYEETQSMRESQKNVEALLDSEARFRAVFENSAVGIARVAQDGHWLEVNQRLCDIIGYSREELLAKTFVDITHPGDLEADLLARRRMLTGEIGTYMREKRYCRKDGSVVWVNLTVSLMRKADGSPDYFISVIEDISARKRAEEELREREERLRLASSAAGLGVFGWNVQLDRAVWENERMYEIFGHTPADGALSKGQLVERYVHPDDVATFEQALADGMESGRPFQTVCRIRLKDGAPRWLELVGNFKTACDGAPVRLVGVPVDITERRQAEDALRASEEQFRIFADTAPVMIWTSGTDKLCDFFKKPWLDFTGRTTEEELGGGWMESIHPEDYARCLETYATSFDAREPFEMEYRLRRYAGEYRWILDHGVPRFSPGGDFLGYIGSRIDITERKEIEKALRESEQRFARFMRHLPGLAWIKDLQGRYVYANAAAVKAFRTPPEELYGRTDDEIFPPETAARFKENDRQALTNEAGIFVVETLDHEDGVLHYSAVRKFPIPGQDDGGTNIGGIAIDITESKHADEALRESEERLAGIVSSAMDAIITVDEDQRIILFNEAAEQMFGCPAAEVLGRPINRFIPDRFHVTHTEHICRYGEAAGAIRAMVRKGALSALRADGAEFPIEASISSAEVGGRKLYTVILRDITELKQAEAEREQLAREQVARAAAEAANRSKDEFLAMVSHELRSPLNVVLGYARMIRASPTDSWEVVKDAAVIERSAKAQLQIIEDLLDLARIITGKLRIEPEPVDLVPTLEAALDTVRAAAEAKRVELVAKFGRLPELVLGDSTRLQQVVWNLLSNSVKFTPEGGRVELCMEGDADDVRVTVNDTGKGIEPEFLPYIFDHFRQADSSSSRRYGGLGLGLSLVKHLVELHGGTITVMSEGAGRGATFTVTLPRRQSEFVAEPTPAVAPREVRMESAATMDVSLSLEGVSVLVVDDQEEARKLLIQTLSEYGAQVTAISSGAEALAFLSDPPGGKRPDVLIIDIAMPDEDGYTALKKVRALEAEQGVGVDQIPAIALTAHGRSEDRLRALQAGFQMHVAKPVEPAELAVAIASLTTRRAWGREGKGVWK
jgi:PAS domain S-box-containing protein